MKTARIIYSTWELALAQHADAAVLREHLARENFEVLEAEAYSDEILPQAVDLQIFINPCHGGALKHVVSGRRNIVLPVPARMPFWFRWSLQNFDGFLCRDGAAYEWARAIQPAGAWLTGFTSRDCLLPGAREARVVPFHAAGTNEKGLQGALQTFNLLSPLRCAAACALPVKHVPGNTIIFGKLPQARYDALRNACRVHLQPPLKDTYSHAVAEAQSAGAAVIFMDEPPARLAEKLRAFFNLTARELEDRQKAARADYLARDALFKKTFRETLTEIMRLPERLHVRPPEPRPMPAFRQQTPEIIMVRPALTDYLYGKGRPALRKPPPLPQFEFSLVTRYMNRRHFLEQTLPTWLKCPHVKEIIIVDWSSSDGLDNVIAAFQNGIIKRLRIPGKRFFHRTKPLNAGCRLAAMKNIAHVDCDVKLKPDFFEIATEDRTLYCNGTGGLFGTCLFTREIFETVNGYSELFENYGDEDVDFYQRVKVRFNCRNIDSSRAFHISHGEGERVGNHAIKSLVTNNDGLIGKWNGSSRMERFEALLLEPGACERSVTV